MYGVLLVDVQPLPEHRPARAGGLPERLGQGRDRHSRPRDVVHLLIAALARALAAHKVHGGAPSDHHYLEVAAALVLIHRLYSLVYRLPPRPILRLGRPWRGRLRGGRFGGGRRRFSQHLFGRPFPPWRHLRLHGHLANLLLDRALQDIVRHIPVGGMPYDEFVHLVDHLEGSLQKLGLLGRLRFRGRLEYGGRQRRGR